MAKKLLRGVTVANSPAPTLDQQQMVAALYQKHFGTASGSNASPVHLALENPATPSRTEKLMEDMLESQKAAAEVQKNLLNSLNAVVQVLPRAAGAAPVEAPRARAARARSPGAGRCEREHAWAAHGSPARCSV